MVYPTVFAPTDAIKAKWPKPAPVGQAPDLRAAVAGLEMPFYGLAVAVVLMRLFARWSMKAFGIDDLLMVLSMVPATVAIAIGLRLRNVGLGMHMWDATAYGLLDGNGAVFARWGIYTFTLCLSVSHIFLRFSVLASLYRIFTRGTEKSMRYTLHVFLAFLIVSSPIIIFTDTFMCTPIQAFWDTNVKNANCSNQRGIMMLGRVVNCVGNFWLFCLPLGRLWKLQVPVAQRVGLVVVFGLGFIVCALSIFKLFFLLKVMYYNPLGDYTWELFPVQLACSLENSLTVICGSAPVLRYYFNLVKGPTKSTLAGSTAASSRFGSKASTFKKGHSSHASTGSNTWIRKDGEVETVVGDEEVGKKGVHLETKVNGVHVGGMV